MSTGDEMNELKRTIDDLNSNHELHNKVSCTTKIMKALQSSNNGGSLDSI